MPDISLPLGAERLTATLPQASVLRLHPGTLRADLSASQTAIGAWLPQTLAAVREALARRAPRRPGKKPAPVFSRVLILVADDSRRVAYDPWIAELADGLCDTPALPAENEEPEGPDEAGAARANTGRPSRPGVSPERLQFFVLGQSDDPPLGLRLIRHLGEDTCGRFAAESHAADHEDDHDPEQGGFDAAALRSTTLLVAARPVFPFPHWTNGLAEFLGRGLLARPLADIVAEAGFDRAFPAGGRDATTTAPVEDPLRGLAERYDLSFGPVVAELLPRVIDAPFYVDACGDPLPAGGANPPAPAAPELAASSARSDVVITAAGGTPTDLWFTNLLHAGCDALPQLAPGGRLIVVGACDEGLPFPDLQAALAELQTLPRAAAWSAMLARARSVESAGQRETLLRLGALCAQAESLRFVSPGLLPEIDDDESERPRRELPPGARVQAHPTLADALAGVEERPTVVLTPE
ncbi:MAG: hypothetical protein ACREJ2_12440 [Planctomycetota bacterium]